MKNLIVTCCDNKYGDFLIKHWVVSLKENVKLDNIEVIVFDYGLTSQQKKSLTCNGVKIKKCIKDGHVTSLRYRDLLNLLTTKKYDQVLMIDGGDIIFQSDISNLFNQNKNSFRAVTETISINFENIYAQLIKSKNLKNEVLGFLKGKEVINGGFILAPSELFKTFCIFYLKNIKHLKSHGIDQVMVNYYLYKSGFIPLDKTYNYMLVSNFYSDKFKVKNNKFYDSKGKLVHIVHNLGGINLTRGFYSFGYNQKPQKNPILNISKVGNSLINKSLKYSTKLTKLVIR